LHKHIDFRAVFAQKRFAVKRYRHPTAVGTFTYKQIVLPEKPLSFRLIL